MSTYSRSSRDHVGRYADRQFGAWLSTDDLTSTLNKVRSFVIPAVLIDALVYIANLVSKLLRHPQGSPQAVTRSSRFQMMSFTTGCAAISRI